MVSVDQIVEHRLALDDTASYGLRRAAPPVVAWGPSGPRGPRGHVPEGVRPPIESRTVPGSRSTRRSRRWALAATLTLVLALAAAACYPPPPPPPQPVSPMTVGVTHPVGALSADLRGQLSPDRGVRRVPRVTRAATADDDLVPVRRRRSVPARHVRPRLRR